MNEWHDEPPEEKEEKKEEQEDKPGNEAQWWNFKFLRDI